MDEVMATRIEKTDSSVGNSVVLEKTTTIALEYYYSKL